MCASLPFIVYSYVYHARARTKFDFVFLLRVENCLFRFFSILLFNILMPLPSQQRSEKNCPFPTRQCREKYFAIIEIQTNVFRTFLFSERSVNPRFTLLHHFMSSKKNTENERRKKKKKWLISSEKQWKIHTVNNMLKLQRKHNSIVVVRSVRHLFYCRVRYTVKAIILHRR